MAVDTSAYLTGMMITPMGLLRIAIEQEELNTDEDTIEEIFDALKSFMQRWIPNGQQPALVFNGQQWLFASADSNSLADITIESRNLRKVNIHALQEISS